MILNFGSSATAAYFLWKLATASTRNTRVYVFANNYSVSSRAVKWIAIGDIKELTINPDNYPDSVTSLSFNGVEIFAKPIEHFKGFDPEYPVDMVVLIDQYSIPQDRLKFIISESIK